jgi:hypothetical protein
VTVKVSFQTGLGQSASFAAHVSLSSLSSVVKKQTSHPGQFTPNDPEQPAPNHQSAPMPIKET